MKKIEIKRNIIEQSLMVVRDFVRDNAKIVLYSFIGIIFIIFSAIAGSVYYDVQCENDLIQYEEIMERHKAFAGIDQAEKIKNLKKTVAELNTLIDSSYWGFVNENGYYIIGCMYYDEKMYKEAKNYCMKFVDNSKLSFFAPVALRKAAISSEALGNSDEAFQLYKRLEKDYAETEIGDQILYDLGRIYMKRGDVFKSREYFNRVVSAYPQSSFSKKAKENLYLSGYYSKSLKMSNKKKK